MKRRHRVCIACISSLVGLAVSVPFVVVGLLQANQGVPLGNEKVGIEEIALLVEFMVLLFGVTFGTGITLYRWIGATDEARVVKEESGAIIPLFEFLAGGLLIVVGVAIIVHASIGIMHMLNKHRMPPP